jgi:hypothetical protein
MARFLRFLEIHEPDALVAEAFFLSMWSAHADDRVRRLERRISKDGRSVALPVEAPNEESVRDAGELSELFAPAERLSHDDIEIA